MTSQDVRTLVKYPRRFFLRIFVLTCVVLAAISYPLRTQAHVTTYYVDSLGDQNDYDPCDGYCSITSGGSGDCTLRAALEENTYAYNGWCSAPADTDLHTISIGVPGTITLTNGVLGASGNLIIEGLGKDTTIIDAGSLSSVFSVGDTVVMRHLQIKNGQNGTGGGLTNGGNLTLEDANVTDNTADATYGGAIRNNGQLTLTRVYIAGNTAIQSGGGIYNASGSSLSIEDSTFYRNIVPDSPGAFFQGGAIANVGTATLNIKRTTFEGNRAPAGGAIFNDGQAYLTNVTLVNNEGTTTGGHSGGAIYNVDWTPGQLWLWNVTISGNESGIAGALTNFGTIEALAHTIVAGNTGGDCYNGGTVQTINEHHNIGGDGSCFSSSMFTDLSDMTSTDPKLHALADNGGPTETMALASDSPAIDAGDPLGCKSGGVALLTDQRGLSRPQDGDDNNSEACDIGAYERIGISFSDVPRTHWAFGYIGAIAEAGLTAGYPDGTYRPANLVTRAEMAVFLLKGIHGASYTPPTPDGSHPFSDISGHWAQAWIEQLYDEGITAGYPDNTYRPFNNVTRAEMAVMLLVAKHGSGYTPPTANGSHPFTDISGHWAETWIEQLYDEGITAGYPDGTYRPGDNVNRAQMAVFLVATFGLTIYY